MAFGQLSTCGVPCIENYEEALRFFEKKKPWRGGSENVRPVHRSRRRHMEMRKISDGSIVFRLYNTDVVTWYPCGDFSVTPYPSKTTDAFAHALLPSGIYPQFTHRLGTLLMIGDRLYKCDRVVHLSCRDGVWRIVDGTLPFTVPVLDKGAARKALHASGFADFLLWRKASTALGLTVAADYFWPGSDGVYDMLQDREQWLDLHGALFTTHREAVLRNHIYRKHGAISYTTKHSLSQAAAQRIGRAARYGSV